MSRNLDLLLRNLHISLHRKRLINMDSNISKEGKHEKHLLVLSKVQSLVIIKPPRLGRLAALDKFSFNLGTNIAKTFPQPVAVGQVARAAQIQF